MKSIRGTFTHGSLMFEYFFTCSEAGSITNLIKFQGFKVVPATECWHKSLVPLTEEVREMIGKDTPVYISFDIDGIDPSFCPGTGKCR